MAGTRSYNCNSGPMKKGQGAVAETMKVKSPQPTKSSAPKVTSVGTRLVNVDSKRGLQ